MQAPEARSTVSRWPSQRPVPLTWPLEPGRMPVRNPIPRKPPKPIETPAPQPVPAR